MTPTVPSSRSAAGTSRGCGRYSAFEGEPLPDGAPSSVRTCSSGPPRCRTAPIFDVSAASRLKHFHLSLRLRHGRRPSLWRAGAYERTHVDPGGAPARYDYKIPFVIGASAAGTVIEWYDFYLYAVLTPFLAPLFFPGDNPTASLLSALRGLRRGLRGAAVRRDRLRPHRRRGRSQVRVPADRHDHGRRDRPGRPAARLRADRRSWRRSSW